MTYIYCEKITTVGLVNIHHFIWIQGKKRKKILLVMRTLRIYSFLFCFVFLIYLILIYLFLAALGLRCCLQAFSSCGEQGLLFVVVRELLIAVASLVAEHGL